jgi:pyridoxine kinase
VSNIVISSMPAPPELGSDADLVCIASTPTATFSFVFPKIDGYFSGVGDLFSALVLARFQGDLCLAVGQALLCVQRILKRTSKHAGDSMQSKELHIIASQSDILDIAAWPHHTL